jgi:hypothetical protein
MHNGMKKLKKKSVVCVGFSYKPEETFFGLENIPIKGIADTRGFSL